MKQAAADSVMERGYSKLDAGKADADFCSPRKRQQMIDGYYWGDDKRYSNDVGGFLERNNTEDRGPNNDGNDFKDSHSPIPFYD
jgi:hypothetical protein